MKLNKYNILTCLLLIFTLSCSRKNPDLSKQFPSNPLPGTTNETLQKNQTNAHKYSVKSGIVTFATEIAGNTGKEILYFDDYGLKEREDFYEDDKLKESVLTDDNIIYKVRYVDKTALNMGIAQRGIAYKVDWNEIPASQKKDGFAIKTDNMKIAGKECESYKVDNSGIITTFAGWGGICMYTNQESKSGNALTTAVNIEENISIPKDKFKLPKGIRVR